MWSAAWVFRRKILLVFILVVAWLKPALAGESPLPLAHAGQSPIQKEAHKAQRIKAILQKQPMYPQVSINDPAFCGPFLDALKSASPKIEYVEPLLKTDNANHPGLKHYRKCEGATYPGGPPDNAFDTFDAIGQKNFRLYRLDLDGNPKNGIEEVIYGEVDWERSYGMNQSPGYSLIDLEQCEFKKDGVPVYQSDRPEGRVLDNYNALIRYQKRYYVLDLDDIGVKQQRYNLTLWNFQANIQQQKDRIPCAWSWRKETLSKESEEK
jgi:hypothetical protein